MNPVGLTRAEEEKEHPTALTPSQPPAPIGTTECSASLPPDGKKCGAEARWLVVWRDPDAKRDPVCTDCANRLRAQARSMYSDVGIEPISP
jgi:hypothetical protein